MISELFRILKKFEDFWGQLWRIMLITANDCWTLSRGNIHLLVSVTVCQHQFWITLIQVVFAGRKKWRHINMIKIFRVSIHKLIPCLWGDKDHIHKTTPYWLKPSNWIYISINFRRCVIFWLSLTFLRLIPIFATGRYMKFEIILQNWYGLGGNCSYVIALRRRAIA